MLERRDLEARNFYSIFCNILLAYGLESCSKHKIYRF